MATFEISVATDGQYYFVLSATTDKRILLRSELYTQKSSCRKGIESVIENAPNDKRYDRLTARNGNHYFNLKAGNGEIIGTSKMYGEASEMEEGIRMVKEQAPTASVVDRT
jgi:uncharacterized protein YegP (UPF0339 family)